jgi:hypothetical protein
MTTIIITSMLSEELVPIVAIVFTFSIPILAMYFYYQNRNRVMEERKLMIEKGITPPPLKDFKEHRENATSLSKGINLIAIALGLLGGYILSHYTNIKFPFSIIGSVILFLGIANVINAFLNPSKPNNDSSLNTNDYEKQ